jgi:putative oxygen-independent coproporphyrinogen III oxidase
MNLLESPFNLETSIQHLYVHVPFCPTICPYCDFHVLERRGSLVGDYLNELRRDAAQLGALYPRSPLKTLYIGGGTPSFLRDAELTALVSTIRQHFEWASEATLEVNPGTVSASRVALWRDLGFTRASLGVQSTQDHVLKFLGRTHDSRQALHAIDALLEAGFEVSADLITAVPGQDLELDLETIGRTGINHVSCYTLTIEAGTPFHRAGVTVREDDEALALERAEPVLSSYGLERYEVSNHARKGFESQHNTAYWQNRFYYGLGAGAAGHYPLASALESPQDVIAQRRTNPHLHDWLLGHRGDLEPVTREDFVTDALFNGLRLKRGIDIAQVSARAGLDARAHFAAAFEVCADKGWLEWDGNTVRATKAGMWVLNKVVMEFMPD